MPENREPEPGGAKPDAVEADTVETDTVETDAVGAEIQRFWEAVRPRVQSNRVEVVTGAAPGVTVPPPAWAFGDSPALADELLGLVLAGRKTATSTSLLEYEAEGEPVPEVGDLSILLDGAGLPAALIRTTAVSHVRFEEVDEDHARAEGEDDLTLASWRREHERYWRRVLGARLAGRDIGDLEVVLERFEVITSRPSASRVAPRAAEDEGRPSGPDTKSDI